MPIRLEGALSRRGNQPVGRYCPIERSLAAVGSHSALVLIREAFYGATRFEEFVARTGLTAATTSSKLRELTAVGVLVKQPYKEPGQRRRDEYVLSDSGKDLFPAVFALFQWANVHDAPPYPPSLRHTECNHQVTVVARCTDGHDVDVDDVAVTAEGPFGLDDPTPA